LKYKKSINKRTFDVIIYTFVSIFQFLHILHIVESKFADLKYIFFFVNFVDMLKYISLLVAISLSVWYDMSFWTAQSKYIRYTYINIAQINKH